MLRVVDSFSVSDTGRQRRHNEDSMLARVPLFVVADGMGGAQAGEVASHIAVETFADGIGDDGAPPEERLAQRVRVANAQIYEQSQTHAEQAGMGSTLTAVYVGPEEIAIAHVGDSRAYLLRDGELMRLTDDHSLVDELVRQGRLTPEEAEDHPQRSIITRALGPEPEVEVDTRTHRGRDGDVYLVCSDGLTSMIHEPQVAEILNGEPDLRAAGAALIAAANAAGGRDNITVLLFRLQEVGPAPDDADQPTRVSEVVDGATTQIAPVPAVDRQADTEVPQGAAPGGGDSAAAERRGSVLVADVPPAPRGRSPAASRLAPSAAATQRVPRRARAAADGPPRRRRRWIGPTLFLASVLAILALALYFATQAIYFVGTDNRGFVSVYSGLPYQLPFGLKLYSQYYVSGVPASTIPAPRRKTLLNHSLRSVNDASTLVRQLELGQIAGAS
jgi:protein phosphatase